MFSETKARSATKAILWRIVAVTNSFVISWFFFETILVALGAAVAMNVTGLFIYYLYERMWNRVGWGKITEATAIKKINEEELTKPANASYNHYYEEDGDL